MRYSIEERKKSRKQIREKLVQLYLSCSSIEEFCVKQETELPEASRNDVRACRLWYFKKMHPVAWALIFVAISFFLAGACAYASLIFIKTPGCAFLFGLLGIFLSMIVFSIHWHLHLDMMQMLEWHETRCSRDY